MLSALVAIEQVLGRSRYCTDEEAETVMKPLIEGMRAYYAKRGIFQGCFGFGDRPAVIVIDFAYKWVLLSRAHNFQHDDLLQIPCAEA